MDESKNVDYFNQISKEKFPAYLGIEITQVKPGELRAKMKIQPQFFAPNGFVHAGSIVTLADTLAGYATVAHLPEGAKAFTTLELKSNFLGAAREGDLEAIAIPEHTGRSTHVWQVSVYHAEKQKKVAFFTCTQLVIY